MNFARENGIAVTAYSSFANTSFLELNMQIARNVPLLLSHPIITPIARKHDRTSAQVVLRWATQRGIAIIPKSNSKTRLLGNLRVNDFGLEQNEIDGISAFNRNLRFHNPLKVSRNYPRAVEVDWSRVIVTDPYPSTFAVTTGSHYQSSLKWPYL